MPIREKIQDDVMVLTREQNSSAFQVQRLGAALHAFWQSPLPQSTTRLTVGAIAVRHQIISNRC